MSLLNRVRGAVLSGGLAVAVAVPALPAVVASPAAAAPAIAAAQSQTSIPAVATEKRRKNSSSRAAARARVVISRGYALRGVPYRYGGSTPSGFDCSGFTSYVYRKAGVSIPRTASAQRRAAKWISRSSARAGDLVFFHKGGRVYHVGIYAGGNRVLHSPRPGKRVEVVNMWTRSVSFGRSL